MITYIYKIDMLDLFFIDYNFYVILYQFEYQIKCIYINKNIKTTLEREKRAV